MQFPSVAQLQKHLPPTVSVTAWQAPAPSELVAIIQHSPYFVVSWCTLSFIFIFPSAHLLFVLKIITSEQSYFSTQRASKPQAHCHETAASFRNPPTRGREVAKQVKHGDLFWSPANMYEVQWACPSVCNSYSWEVDTENSRRKLLARLSGAGEFFVQQETLLSL